MPHALADDVATTLDTMRRIARWVPVKRRKACSTCRRSSAFHWPWARSACRPAGSTKPATLPFPTPTGTRGRSKRRHCGKCCNGRGAVHVPLCDRPARFKKHHDNGVPAIRMAQREDIAGTVIELEGHHQYCIASTTVGSRCTPPPRSSTSRQGWRPQVRLTGMAQLAGCWRCSGDELASATHGASLAYWPASNPGDGQVFAQRVRTRQTSALSA